MINDNHKRLNLSPDAASLVALVTSGTLNEWQTVAAVEKIGQLDPRDRTDVWLALRDELSPELYSQIHGFYVEYCLSHSWRKI